MQYHTINRLSLSDLTNVITLLNVITSFGRLEKGSIVRYLPRYDILISYLFCGPGIIIFVSMHGEREDEELKQKCRYDYQC